MRLVMLAVLGLLLTSCAASDDYIDGDVWGTLRADHDAKNKLFAWSLYSYTGSYYLLDKSEVPLRSHGPGCSYEVHMTYRVNRNSHKTEFPRLLSVKHSGTGNNCPK